MLCKRRSLSIFRTPSTIQAATIYVAVTGPALALVAVLMGLSGSVGTAVSARAARPASLAVSGVSHPAVALWPVFVSSSQLVSSAAKRPAGRPAAVPGKVGAVAAAGKAAGHTSAARPSWADLTPKQLARRMLGEFGWPQWQFRYLDLLWTRESGWNVYATNPYSGAYGIPQAVPASKMASAGPDWQSDARTQIRWGLGYIKDVYGSPEAAWQHEVSDGWY